MQSHLTDTNSTKLSLIVAMTKNRVIGKNNQMPWHLSEDLVRMRKITKGHPLIMGRKNYESIGKPLGLDRTTIILTRNQNFTTQDNEIVITHSKEEALEKAKNSRGSEEVFIFGGEQIYTLFLKYVQKMYITLIDKEIEGDTFFPDIKYKDWKRTKNIKRVVKYESCELKYYFKEYIKI